MAKMTLEELRKLRAGEKQALSNREIEGKEVQVIIGMGTCGIAAGAKETMDGFVNTINANGLKNVTIRQTGCMGLCYAEPTVEVKMAGMADTIYGNVDAEVAKKIVEHHIMNKRLVNKHIFDKPAADITQ
ncbi:MAG: (2Fe-2S) ferredoxin domain-containing protein [Spirochaetales bacterium]|nr:(2Fe-2S) ferredoxin domain-containing protein [Spirochaetales bacterium]